MAKEKKKKKVVIRPASVPKKRSDSITLEPKEPPKIDRS